MMIRGDQHVDDWAEVSVDYLDGRLDDDARDAVEAHLSQCPECTARLRGQQYVVRFLQDTALDDPPADLEYRSIGEVVFPSPGGRPLGPAETLSPKPTPRWYRTVRTWLPAGVAVCALIAAVTGYSIARSGEDTQVANDASRSAGSITTVIAGAATTAAATLSEAGASGAGPTLTSAGATTTVLAAAAPSTDAAMTTVTAVQDPKAMTKALATAQGPTYVSFRASITTPPATDAGGGTNTDTTAAGATDTTTAGGGTPAPTEDTTATQTGALASGPDVGGAVTAEQAQALLDQLTLFTGLQPVDPSLWLGGPTFAVYLPRKDASKLVDLVKSMGSSLELVVSVEGGPPEADLEICARLLEQKGSFPVLVAHRAKQPATWGYDFTTSTMAPATKDGSGTTDTLPDEAGTHVLVIIWIAE